MTLRPVWTITRSLEISAAHHLDGMPEGHKCSGNHGHNYDVLITLVSMELDKAGFVLDFGIIKDAIMKRFDHADLNQRMTRNPTAENFALEIAEVINDVIFKAEDEGKVRVARVEVRETSNCTAVLEFLDDE